MAEPIGWHEQRISLAKAPEAVTIMQNARKEEFRHFRPDLEFLLRHRPVWSKEL